MDAPTPTEIRQHSPLLLERYPDGEPADASLTRLIAVVAPLVGSMTGRAIAGSEGEDVPVGLHELAVQAIAMKAEQFLGQFGSAEGAEEAIERSHLRSIAAGSWSESYFGPGEAAKAKQLDNDPILAALLWALCTDIQKDEWLFLWDPANAPGFSVLLAYDYRMRPGGY